MPLFGRIAVLGLGLLGGSVALAARRAGAAGQVVGANRRREVVDAALARGAIDAGGSFEQAVKGADLVVLCTAVRAMPALARRVAPQLREGAVVTDVGSVKAWLAETLPGLLPPGASYVGSHPMAGSHRSGLAHARADLFDGAVCIVESGGDAEAAGRVCEFWRLLGARVLRRAAAQHDAEVAWMSHLPHLLAFAYAEALAQAPPGAGAVAGSGFRDFTRIAHSSPELWGDILTANRKALSGPLQAAGEALAALGRALEAGDAQALEGRIRAAQASLCRTAGTGDPSQIPAAPTRSGPERSTDDDA